jgi:hypothetical protein
MTSVAWTSLPPTSRALARTPAFWLVGLAVAPVLVTVARGGDDLGMAVVATAVLGGSCAGGAVEDAAARTLAASPTTRLARRLSRLAVMATSVVAAWVSAALVAHAADAELGPLAPHGAEVAATAGLSVLVASAMGPEGDAGVGLTGAGGAVLGMLTSTAMAVRYPWFPSLGQDESTGAWWLLAAVAWSAAAWLNRDPATRGVVARPRSAPFPGL